jgi:transcription elongation factor GreB
VSKAFTKDEGPDEAPIPRRRAPLPVGSSNYVTPRGLRALREELALLDGPTTPPANAQETQVRAAWRDELEQRISTAIVVAPPEDRQEVRFGASVRVRTSHGRLRDVQIVGLDEADGHERISFTAPLARALLGKRVADSLMLRRPGGEEELEIVAIAYDDRPSETPVR